MTKEEFEKEKESIEQLFFDDTFKESDYFSALNTLQKEYIETLENERESFEKEVIKKTEDFTKLKIQAILEEKEAELKKHSDAYISKQHTDLIKQLENVNKKLEIATDILFDCHGEEMYFDRIEEEGLAED